MYGCCHPIGIRLNATVRTGSGGERHMLPVIHRDASLLKPVRNLLLLVRRNGLKLAQKLRANATSMNRLSTLIGRRNVMMCLGL